VTGRVLKLAVAAVAVLGILAAPSSAGASIAASEVIFAIADGSQNGATAGCGGGQALGTGYGSFANESDFLYLNTLSIPDNAPDEVNVYADNYTGGSPSVQAIAQLVCDSNAGPGAYRLRDTPGFKNVPDASEGGATARCRNGESVVGGAVYNQGAYSDESYINSTGPIDLDDRDKIPDDGWHGEVNNDEDASGDTLDMKVHAFCDTKHNNVSYRSKTTKVTDGDLEGAIVKCRHDGHLIGGGVLSHSSYPHGLYVSDTYKDQDAWESRVANWPTPDAKTRKITTTAICLG
jgi:hypothetical protein